MRILNRRTDPIPHDAVYVGRGSRWGNPYRIGRHGSRNDVIESYRTWLWSEIRSGRLSLDELRALDGRDLVCWCAPKRCHAEVLRCAIAWSLRARASATCA